MKLSDFPEHFTKTAPWFSTAYVRKYGKVVDDDIKPLFHTGYYDGPLSGIVKCHDEYFYVKAVYEEDRKYWVAWELSEEEKETALTNHKLFQTHVGYHTDYYEDDSGEFHRVVGKDLQPHSEWHKYYDNKEKPTLDINKIISRDIFAVLRNPFVNW